MESARVFKKKTLALSNFCSPAGKYLCNIHAARRVGDGRHKKGHKSDLISGSARCCVLVSGLMSKVRARCN